MTDPKPLGAAIADHFTAQAQQGIDRPFEPDTALEALSARLADMRTTAPGMYAAHSGDRERVERYEMRKADHLAGRQPAKTVGLFGGVGR